MARLLIIEPDRLLAGSLRAYFVKAGYLVLVHSDPQAAITSADSRQPDTVIAELQLAGRSGVEFLYEFRSYPDWQAIPIIIYTNLHPEAVAGYTQVIKDLNISACLYKTTTGLADLAQAVQQAQTLHAKV